MLASQRHDIPWTTYLDDVAAARAQGLDNPLVLSRRIDLLLQCLSDMLASVTHSADTDGEGDLTG